MLYWFRAGDFSRSSSNSYRIFSHAYTGMTTTFLPDGWVVVAILEAATMSLYLVDMYFLKIILMAKRLNYWAFGKVNGQAQK